MRFLARNPPPDFGHLFQRRISANCSTFINKAAYSHRRCQGYNFFLEKANFCSRLANCPGEGIKEGGYSLLNKKTYIIPY
jgi:hypothetical protein